MKSQTQRRSSRGPQAAPRQLADDLAHFAATCLTIRGKDGALGPLVFNRAQRFVHERLAAQHAATGRVRALILKGRQQGCSTYVAARFYHRVIHANGLRVFILTHEDAATQNLFEIVERFHAHCDPLVKPSTGAANSKELYFDRLQSGYKVGTAGTKGVGRSATIQLFHGSEVAFWPFAADACRRHPAGGAGHRGHRGDSGVDRERHGQFLPRDLARRRGRRERLRRDLRAVVLAGRVPTSPAARFRAERRGGGLTRRCTASTMASSRGGAPRSRSSRTRRCFARNIRRTRRKPSR